MYATTICATRLHNVGLLPVRFSFASLSVLGQVSSGIYIRPEDSKEWDTLSGNYSAAPFFGRESKRWKYLAPSLP